MGSQSRVHYMDNLRAYAMLLGIFFHAALAYSPLLNGLWLTADSQNAPWVDALAYFTHTFRMPLFFIIAGFFSAMLVQKRGTGGFIKQRLLRIALPFAIFLPLVMAAFALSIGWAMENVEQKSPMLGFIAMMANYPDAPPPPVTTTHLWFLYYLTFFVAIAAIVSKFLTFNWMRYVAKSPLTFLIVAPLLLIPALTTQYAPIPAPEQFMPQWWAFAYFGLFYLLGWGLFSNQDFLDKLLPYTWPMLLLGLVSYAGYFQLIPKSISLEDTMGMMANGPELNIHQVLLASLNAYISVFMCLALLMLGRKFLNKENALTRFIADSSYWVYIIHLPVLWMIQFVLLDTDYPLIVEFLISCIGTLIIGALSYIVLVKKTPIGWLLNGKKAKQG